MERHFDDDLSKFHDDILKMAALTEEAINKSVESIKSQNISLAQSVIKEDKKIDEFELKVEEQAIDLLALYQPMAIDLRYITTGMKINTELERIADLAVNISHKVLELSEQPLLKELVNIPKLSDVARSMVKKSIDSFVKRDAKLAREVIDEDTESDHLRNQIMKILIHDYMVKDGKTAPRAVPLLLVARDLERMCDRASAIAEDVLYMINAVHVKHHPEMLSDDEKM